MKLTYRLFEGPLDWGFIQEHLDIPRVQDTCGLMCIDEETNETVGAIILDNIWNNCCVFSGVITTPMVLKYGFGEECADFVFEGLGREYLYAYVRSDNKKSLRFNKRLGFETQMIMPDAYADGVDYIVQKMHRDDCPFYFRNRLHEKKQEVA